MSEATTGSGEVAAKADNVNRSSQASLLTLVWLAFAVAGSAAGADAPRSRYSIDELVFLNGFGGWGDTGRLDTSREIVAPGSKLGFSLKVLWEHHPGNLPFWVISTNIRLPTAVRMDDFDRLSCDLYVEDNQGATLTIFLTEDDGDRWVLREGPLAEQDLGRWQHVEMQREAMKPWLLGNRKLEWDRVTGFTLEPSHGKALFYVDNVVLLGANGGRYDVFNDDDDGFRTDASQSQSVRIPEPGTVYFPAISTRDFLEARTPHRFSSLLGRLGTSVPLDTAGIRELDAAGVASVFYSQFGAQFYKFLTRRQAWDVDCNGGSPNWIGRGEKEYNDVVHCKSLAHPAVLEAGRASVDALVKAGIGAWMVVDYTFYWPEGPWGYSPAMVAAYRLDLAGQDDGLLILDRGVSSPKHFEDYFRGYNGFYPTPRELGLESWDGFTPPRPGEAGESDQAAWRVFMYLRSYEWLKLLDRTGRYYQSKGGHGIWVVPNPEDSWGSSDYVYLQRMAGTRNLFPEWFGDPGSMCEGAYAAIPYLREQTDLGGSRLSVLFETGAGGHAQPYWDWRPAYTCAYVLSAVSRADDFDNDFMGESQFDFQSNPANALQFNRFRDGVAKARGFLSARAEQPRRPQAQILCIGERPPARDTNSLFFGFPEAFSFAKALSRSHLPFDSRDSFELERVIDRYQIIACSPFAPRVGDPERISRWLDDAPGRVLVTHTFVPTRDTSGWWGRSNGQQLGPSTWAETLGLGAIRATETTSCKVTAAAPGWEGIFPAGEELTFVAPLTQTSLGKPLVQTAAGALVTEARVGKGRVVYLHCSSDRSDPAVMSVYRRVLQELAEEAGILPLAVADPETLVQTFDVTGGRVLALWDAPTLSQWKWEYKAGIAALEYAAPDVSRQVRLKVTAGPWLVYDFLANVLEPVAVQDGELVLPLRGTLCRLCYVGADSPGFRATIAAAQAVRTLFRDLSFDSTPDTGTISRENR